MTDDDGASDGDRSELIDQYTTYVDTTLNVSNRRMRNNRFYVLLLSGTLAVVSVLADTQIIEEVGLLIAGLLGLALCILWYLSIVSYKQLNSGKYEIIQAMEKDLPAEPFANEWDVLDEGRDWRTYITHTRVERKIPGVLAVPYLIITIYATIRLV
ncbi:small integral membrane protein [Halalkaliarchaeum desulfuricum]|uniref:Small integral membrane protein n=1 Tax=Halalkaliarchaeum desulfuricum TaxID=2055893 RepID=A0A343TLG2_9EURY|nr:hypothetical protein [Halalkaliarchaeum desulfuricum]AUX09934.1 small integral membrane protein [Halalkaliarchaeum desulfuricum]